MATVVREAFENHVKLVESRNSPGHVLASSEASFFVADLNDVVRKWAAWKEALPDVTPFFAVKSSYDRRLIQTLATCGAGFDCASAEEIELILSLGIGAERIIFTHPCKPVSSLGLCRKLGITLITFDNECELRKLHHHYPEAQTVLRVFADDPTNADPLGTKFGAAREDLDGLVRLVKELNMQLAGASFHAAPSVAVDAAAYVRGIQDAAEVFARARQVGLNPTVLDIGGGYTDSTFQQIAGAVRPAIAECFKSQVSEGRLRILAEPGTLFSCSPFYLAVKVVARRRSATAFGHEPATRLYINDGIYSNFMMHFIVNMTFSPAAVIREGVWHDQADHKMRGEACSLWGRSCDSNDCINRDCRLDPEVGVGDWLVFKDMGAYTTVCNTTFNGFTSSNHTIYLEPTQVDKAQSTFEQLELAI
uniref:LolD n=1 Tax=Epichloe brachyelytri TaxID=79589 RepID=G8EB06_9HYPO|nr:LolD [Epichloe brachyelytri]